MLWAERICHVILMLLNVLLYDLARTGLVIEISENWVLVEILFHLLFSVDFGALAG